MLQRNSLRMKSHLQYYEAPSSILWRASFNIMKSLLQYYEEPSSKLWRAIFNIMKSHLQYYEEPSSILWRAIFNIMKSHLQYYEEPSSILWRAIFNIMKSHLQYYEEPSSILWRAIFNIMKSHLQYYEEPSSSLSDIPAMIHPLSSDEEGYDEVNPLRNWFKSFLDLFLRDWTLMLPTFSSWLVSHNFPLTTMLSHDCNEIHIIFNLYRFITYASPLV